MSTSVPVIYYQATSPTRNAEVLCEATEIVLEQAEKLSGTWASY